MQASCAAQLRLGAWTRRARVAAAAPTAHRLPGAPCAPPSHSKVAFREPAARLGQQAAARRARREGRPTKIAAQAASGAPGAVQGRAWGGWRVGIARWRGRRSLDAARPPARRSVDAADARDWDAAHAGAGRAVCRLVHVQHPVQHVSARGGGGGGGLPGGDGVGACAHVGGTNSVPPTALCLHPRRRRVQLQQAGAQGAAIPHHHHRPPVRGGVGAGLHHVAARAAQAPRGRRAGHSEPPPRCAPRCARPTCAPPPRSTQPPCPCSTLPAPARPALPPPPPSPPALPLTSPPQAVSISPLALVHTLGNSLTNISLGAVAVSFTHTIKALEPMFSGEGWGGWVACVWEPMLSGEGRVTGWLVCGWQGTHGGRARERSFLPTHTHAHTRARPPSSLQCCCLRCFWGSAPRHWWC